jgi:hypothetical protein
MIGAPKDWLHSAAVVSLLMTVAALLEPYTCGSFIVSSDCDMSVLLEGFFQL